MTTSQALAALGTLLQRKDGLGVYQTIAEVTNISGPALSLETIDVTHMESPDNTREVIASFKSAGEVTFDVNFQPESSSFTDLLADWKNRVKSVFQIVWPSAGNRKYRFSAYVTGLEPAGAVDDKLTASVTLTVTSAPDFNAV